MKILVIFTGGTIASSLSGDYLSVDSACNYTLLNKFDSEKDIKFDTLSPYTILSENLSANELNLLQNAICKNLYSGYDGIIVTHGTDTLQFASCAIELAFSNSTIPIVFVSSAYPLEDKRANGFDNFKAAIEFIRQKISGGVFVSYKNQMDTDVKINVPSKILQHEESRDDIHIADNSVYALYDEKIKLVNSQRSIYKNSSVVNYSDESGILVIDSHPGDGYSYCLNGIKAVIIKPYHSSTLNTASQKLREFCICAKEKGISVYTINTRNDTEYESVKEFNDLSIIPLPSITYISAYIKIWASLSTGKDLSEFI